MNKIITFLKRNDKVIPAVLCIAILVLAVMQINTLSKRNVTNSADGENNTQSTQPAGNNDTSAGDTNAGNNDNNDTPAPTQQAPEDTNAEDTPAPTQAPDDTPAPTQAPNNQGVTDGDITATFTVDDNTWEDNGKTASRVSVLITNNGSETATDWSVTVDVPSGSEISQGWNASFSISGDKLTITSESHTREIPPGGNYPDVGFIILSGDKIKFG